MRINLGLGLIGPDIRPGLDNRHLIHKVSSSGKMDRMGVRESIDLLIAAVCYLVCRM